ncbi:unnamed protein product [Calypogeia fissa]
MATYGQYPQHQPISGPQQQQQRQIQKQSRSQTLRNAVNRCGCPCWGGSPKDQKNKQALQSGEDEQERSSRRETKTSLWRSSKRRTRRRRETKGMGADEGETSVGDEGAADSRPDHLVILVNGIVGSANDWRFAANRMRTRLGRNVAIHCSSNNSALKTFDGVDVMGRRLANEVRQVIDRTPSATRISFLAHSLGGLVTRYAIAELYRPPILHIRDVGDGVTGRRDNSAIEEPSEVTIGGLKPENFITLASPHLGCRGTAQLPFLLGIQVLEKTAPSLAHWFVGKTGKHLFLTDATGKELPLLRKMVTDCKEGQFISSLGAFKRRTLYANVVNDHMVGWRTSSIRLKSEKPDVNRKPVDPKYPHIILEEEPVPPLGQDLTVGVLRREGKRGDDLLEEEMVAGLTRIAWHRVDVRFKGEKGSYQAHNIIQVKNEKIHRAGADVIEHIIDKQFAADQSVEQSDVQ